MSRATPTAIVRIEEPTTVNAVPDLAAHPAVRAVRADIEAARLRVAVVPAGTPGGAVERLGRALAAAVQALEEDPALGLDFQTPRAVDLIDELVYQLGPLSRQAALVAEAERLEQDAGLTGAACSAHPGAEPLPAAEPGRVRRYCSPPCRTRARRAAANR